MATARKRSSGIASVVTWQTLGFSPPRPEELISLVREIGTLQTLVKLVRLLRMGDAPRGMYYRRDSITESLYRSRLGSQAAAQASEPNHVLHSRWQLLFAIKIISVFGSLHGAPDDSKTPEQVLELLLKINDFIHSREGRIPKLVGVDEQIESVKSVMIQQSHLLIDENPLSLIGRYFNLWIERVDPNLGVRYDNWVDVQDQFRARFGLSLTDFTTVCFGLYVSTPTVYESVDGSVKQLFPSEWAPSSTLVNHTPPFCLNWPEWFKNAQSPADTISRALDLITESPGELARRHKASYGDELGHVYDLTDLLRRPILKLSQDCIVALSPYLLVKRLSSGAYWDLHDSLQDRGEAPNRQTFQAFFGRLLEDYGKDLLRRVEAYGFRRRLIWEDEYQQGGETTSDGIIVEPLGRRKRSTLFEFTVGRPRLTQTVIPGDVAEFEKDVASKLGSALSQQEVTSIGV